MRKSKVDDKIKLLELVCDAEQENDHQLQTKQNVIFQMDNKLFILNVSLPTQSPKLEQKAKPQTWLRKVQF